MLPPRILAAACLAAGMVMALPPPATAVTGNGRLQIHHIDVGQGDGLLIISPEGQTAMVDDGVYTDCTKVKAYLQSLGVTQLTYHFASHYHADHVGCIDDLAAIGITVQVAGWDRGYSYTTATYTTYVNTLGAKRRTLAKNQVILLDSLSAHPVTIKCVDLNGAGVYSVSGSDENAKTVVLKVSYGEFDAELGGDLTGSTAQGNDVESTVGPEVGQVEVYKAHHHGSRYSSNVNWLNATRPRICIVSCGNGNTYGHPTAEAIDRLHAAGVRTYWTETGAGAVPNPTWDKVANGHIVVSATWEPGGVDTVRGPAFADTFTNSGTPSVPTAVEEPSLTDLVLAPPAPNPGFDDWLLRFALPREGAVRLEIVDVMGRRLWLVEGSLPAGTHIRRWDGLDTRGQRVGSGLYFVRLVTPWGVRLARGVMLR